MTDKEEWIMTNNEMENRTILFQGKEIDVDDEPGETSDMIHHPDHYTWRGIVYHLKF